MDDELLKLECLKRAQEEGLKGQAARDEAQRIFNWSKGRSENAAPAPSKARVVGRDGQLEPPFDDYLKDNS